MNTALVTVLLALCILLVLPFVVMTWWAVWEELARWMKERNDGSA